MWGYEGTEEEEYAKERTFFTITCYGSLFTTHKSQQLGGMRMERRAEGEGDDRHELDLSDG